MVFFGNIAIDRLYRLRWRFDFAGKNPKYGIWNDSGGKQDEAFGSSAWCTNKNGLVRASIEGECQHTWAVKTLVQCDGHDFVNFWWRKATPAPFMLQHAQSLEIQGQLIGCTLETRETLFKVKVDGTIEMAPKTEADKRINLAGFGK